MELATLEAARDKPVEYAVKLSLSALTVGVASLEDVTDSCEQHATGRAPLRTDPAIRALNFRRFDVFSSKGKAATSPILMIKSKSENGG